MRSGLPMLLPLSGAIVVVDAGTRCLTWLLNRCHGGDGVIVAIGVDEDDIHQRLMTKAMGQSGTVVLVMVPIRYQIPVLPGATWCVWVLRWGWCL